MQSKYEKAATQRDDDSIIHINRKWTNIFISKEWKVFDGIGNFVNEKFNANLK